MTVTPPRGRVTGLAVCALVLLSLGHGLSHGALPAWPAGLCVWLVGARLLRSIAPVQKIQLAVMAGAGCVGLVYGAVRGEFDALGEVVAGNQAILAMLAAVSFLRLVASSGDEADGRLPRGPAAVLPTLLAVHCFGAIINISAVFVVGQQVALRGQLTPLQAKVLTRAFVAAACWSPLFASMAVVLHYVPGVSIAHVISLTLPFALGMLACAWWDLRRDPAGADFVGFPLHRAALTAPLTLSALVLGLNALPTGWPVLSIIVLAALACVALLSLPRPWTETRQRLSRHVEHELPRMGGEFALFLGATLLAAGIGTVVTLHPPSLVLDPTRAAAGIPLLVALVAITLCGVHPVISLATAASLLPSPPTAPDVLAVVALMAWAITLGTSPVSGTTLAMHGRFGVPSTRFLRWNGGFSLMTLVLGCAALLAADYFDWA